MEANNTLNSFQKINKAEPSPFLFDKIMAKIDWRKQQVVPVKWAYLSIVVIVGVLILNLTITSNLFNSKTNTTLELFSNSDKSIISYE